MALSRLSFPSRVIAMSRSLITASSLLALSLSAASVASAQRPVGRPTETEERAPARRPAPNPGHAATPATPPAAVPASGKYRVTITGFRVNRETYDTFLETDGKGDEIRLTASVQALGPDGEMVGEAKTLTTPTYGDVNNFPSRIQAGSRSDKGGLKTGDTFPSGDPSVRHEAPSVDRLPMIAWEGELRTGQNGVAIAPVVWELDEDDVLRSPLNGLGAAAKLARTIGPIASLVPGMGLLAKGSAAIAGVAQSVANSVKEHGNRQVGLVAQGRGYQFTPQVLLLTTATAEALLAGRGGARSPGVIELRYRDAEDLKGDYSVYLQIERIP